MSQKKITTKKRKSIISMAGSFPNQLII